MFDGLKEEPGALKFAWIHFMMFSTLVHFFVAGFATMLLLPDSWCQWTLRDWDKSNHARIVAFGWISLAPVLALLEPTLLLWDLYELLTAQGGTIGNHLLV